LTTLPVVLLLGFGTFLRLVEADVEDAWLVIGMNRIRHAYLELAPELEPYFVAGHYDDPPGLLQTYSFRRRVGVSHWLSGSPVMVGIIDSVVAGALAGVVLETLGATSEIRTLVGVLTSVTLAAVLGLIGIRRVRQVGRAYRPRFPSPSSEASEPAQGDRPGWHGSGTDR
jgi:hypothetical protein